MARTKKTIDTDGSPKVQSGFSVFNPQTLERKPMTTKPKLTAEEKEAAKQARAEAAAAKKEAAAQAKADKAAAIAAKKEAAAQAKAEKAAAREAARAEAGDPMKMGALRDAKSRYVKGKTGTLHADDELGKALEGVTPVEIVPMALRLLNLDHNPYERLNAGQQSMNLRNKLRGAIKRGVIAIDDVIAAVGGLAQAA